MHSEHIGAKRPHPFCSKYYPITQGEKATSILFKVLPNYPGGKGHIHSVQSTTQLPRGKRPHPFCSKYYPITQVEKATSILFKVLPNYPGGKGHIHSVQSTTQLPRGKRSHPFCLKNFTILLSVTFRLVGRLSQLYLHSNVGVTHE